MRKNKGVRVFQSTPPRRRRPVAQAEADRDSISIHASAKEATFNLVNTVVNLIISIHASAKEATVLVHQPYIPHLISIHASAKEATGNILSVEKMKKFQSTPPRRRRQMLLFHLLYNFQFQSTPPRRRRPFFATPSAHFFISIHASAKEATIVFQFRYSNF